MALMRHALAPGTGDPVRFNVNDCSTQRNLSDEGQEQSRRIGALFRQNGIDAALVYSSQWCRCLDTANLLGLGAVEPLRIINSFFQTFDRGPMQTAALGEWMAQAPLVQPTILVTHQVNITAFTGVYPSSGEIVFLKRGNDGAMTVVGTVETQ